ncbi:unnamed protein product [Prorocentrum cordatum]|uniref:Uncharacterized protein n=1 Tax=Prorocentrum cordatum TaxID=2364126 RepID=A0ABN9Y438_9DINO|nr:unnamed protein product [Polarella glacialis]
MWEHLYGWLPKLLDLSLQSAVSAAICSRPDTVVNLSCPAPPPAQVELHCPEVHIPPVQVECVASGPGLIGYLAYGIAVIGVFVAGWVCGAPLAVPTWVCARRRAARPEPEPPVPVTPVPEHDLQRLAQQQLALIQARRHDESRGSCWRSTTDAGNYFMLTPDGDAYVEDCSPASADVERICGTVGLGGTLHGLQGANIYRFRGPPAVEELRQHFIDAALALGCQPPRTVSGCDVSEVMTLFFELDLHRHRGPPTPGALARDVEDLPTGTEMELPADTISAGDRAIMPQLTRPEVYRFTYDDLRVQLVFFDAGGSRRVGFSEGVQRQDDTLPAGGLDLQGPRAAAWLCWHIAENGPTPQAAHEAWISKAKLHEGDWAIHEHFVLSQVLAAAVCHDQLDIPALKCMEPTIRRLQLIKSAYAQSASAPDFSGLAAHMATKFRGEAAVLKESRKAAEERRTKQGKGAAGASPPRLMGVIDNSGRGVIDGHATAMLRSPVEMGAIMDQLACIEPYMGVRPKRDRFLYYQFVRDLFESNLVGQGPAAEKRAAAVQPTLVLEVGEPMPGRPESPMEISPLEISSHAATTPKAFCRSSERRRELLAPPGLDCLEMPVLNRRTCRRSEERPEKTDGNGPPPFGVMPDPFDDLQEMLLSN